MSRRNAREQALVLLYQCDLRKKQPDVIWNEFRSFYAPEEEGAIPLEEQDFTFIHHELTGVWNRLNDIDQTIGRNSRRWEIGRLSAPLRAILRIAVYEIHYCDDIPDVVSINEAVELAKGYDSPEAGAFVNGILAGVLREMKE